MSIDLLEQRLEKLVVVTPDAGRITARVLSRAVRPRVRRLPRVVALGAATVALAVLVAYFVPAADTALASVPFAGDLLRSAGLIGASDRITSVGSVSGSSGYRLQLVGAYADSTRTVLLLHSQPPIAYSGFGSEVTDQFGRAYPVHGSISNTLSGDIVLELGALAWPDAITGARITLRITQVGTADNPPRQVAGAWTLPATLGVDEAKPLPLPADATTGPAHYRFTSVTYTPASITIDIEITGVTSDDLRRRIPDGGKGTAVFSIELVDRYGVVVSGGYGLTEDQQGVKLSFLGYRQGPGNYTLRVSYLGGGYFERILHVP